MNKKRNKIAVLFISIILAVGAFSVCSYAAGNGISRVSCTVYKSGDSGRGFCWYTQNDCETEVQIVKTENFNGRFSKAKSYPASTKKYKGQYVHKAFVTDLEPGVSYTYRVGDKKAGVWSGTGTFRTDDADEKFSFLTIADVQSKNDEEFLQAATRTKIALDAVPNAEFLINLGDFVDYNNDEQWDNYFERFSPVNMNTSLVPVAGNHDSSLSRNIALDGTRRFENMFALDTSKNAFYDGVNYSFDYGNAHFAVLNTNDMWPMSASQKNWLINDMTASDARWKIVLAHRSFYSAGKNINKPDTIIMREQLLPIIDALDIDLVLSGHDHMYLRTAPIRGDKVTETEYITGKHNGKKTVFALNPEGTVYIIPSTMGAKRYSVNEKAIPPILDSAEKVFSTKGVGGCFSRVVINGQKLVYTAYTVDDETGEIKKVDSYAIKKTEDAKELKAQSLPQGGFVTALNFLPNLAQGLLLALKSYVRLLFSLI